MTDSVRSLGRPVVKHRRSHRAASAPSGLLVIAVVLLVTAIASIVEPWMGLVVLSLILVVGLLRLPGRATSLLVIYVFALFVISSRYTLGTYSVTVSTLVGGVALMFWLLGRVLPGSEMQRGFPPVVLAVLGSVGLLVVTYAAAQLHPLTENQLNGADRHFVELLAYTGAALLVCDTVRTRRDRERVLFAVVLAGGIVAVIGIIQFCFEFDISSSLRPPGFQSSPTGFIYSRSGFNRVAGTARHPIEFGVVCAVVLPLALHLAHHALSNRVRRISMVSAVALAVVIPMALSRSALVALVVIVVVLVPSWPSERRWKAIFALAGVLAMLTIVAPGLLSTTNDLINGRQGAESLEYREQANDKAIELGSERPWFGHGYGTFDSEDQFILDNTYLTMLVEGGTAGLIALGVLLLLPSAVALETRHESRDPVVRDLAQTLLAMMLAMTVAGWGLSMLSFPLLAGLLFLTIGMIGALARSLDGESSRASEAAAPESAVGGAAIPVVASS
jgi:O-antigen ligase